MAEELAAPEAEPGSELAPVEEPQIESTETQPEPGPVEALASEMGWVPKDQFRGEPDEWREPAEFIKAGRDITRTVTRQLRSVQEQLQRVTSASGQLMADKIAERDAYWQGIHRKAVEDGDVDLAERAATERTNLKTQAPAADNTLPPETVDFMERHKSWMGKDPLATMRAETLAGELAKRGVTVTDQLIQVERAIKKEFPELFPAKGKAPPGTQTAQARNAGGGSGKKGFADMPAESQAMAKDYQTRHGIPLEKFAESYWQQNQERKVG